MSEPLPLPDFVNWPLFPFEGDLRVKPLDPPLDREIPRSGEPGGPPCRECASTDDGYLWVDDHWRVKAKEERSPLPMQVFLESREHVDMDGLDDERAAELGQRIVRLDRAMQAIGGIGRVQVARTGDGGSHFHLWFYARPFGAFQLLGFFLPMWAIILPPIDEATWDRNCRIVATELAKGGGRSMLA
ncbi:MAG: hypothetical protein JWN67_727 [Actinomycetia bacterium]|nr:hypothetical protein [Actinomycetes bacterium]